MHTFQYTGETRGVGIEQHSLGRYNRRHYYISGSLGHYLVRTCGNNRLMIDELSTIEDARAWMLGCPWLTWPYKEYVKPDRKNQRKNG